VAARFIADDFADLLSGFDVPQPDRAEVAVAVAHGGKGLAISAERHPGRAGTRYRGMDLVARIDVPEVNLNVVVLVFDRGERGVGAERPDDADEVAFLLASRSEQPDAHSTGDEHHDARCRDDRPPTRPRFA
jgi:hypothetical protein